ncbi:Hypothetical protein CINCED_3A023853 [Cinara cedri]|uniref:Uncharacterized protein n=1 Tax=Cinara cedri TaxID=506608 RepID=A0A5E4N1J9_9HEMI|nr:Hypothetical protein CINCED_3A023853 [Cinara cedri]
MDQYHYHGRKMDRLYSAMHITNEGPVTIDDLMYRCTRLGRSLQDKYSELVGRTAVTLLKREMVCGHGVQMTRSELNAHKVMFVALNLVDLTLNAYESDYNEACQELLQKKSSISMKKKGSIFLENEESINTTVDMQDQSKECAIIREDWIEMTKPMIYKHLEWAVDRILDYNVRWTECQHRIDDETINNKHAQDSIHYKLLLTNNGPVTTGANITINATVVDYNGNCIKGSLTFKYKDDAFPRHISNKETKSCQAIFNVPFETTIGPSIYRYQIDVFEQIIPLLDIPIVSDRGQLNITEYLNGQLQVFQNNTNLSKNDPQIIYVSSSLETVYKIELNAADMNYLNTNSNSITIYWFVDCMYHGNTTNYTFSSNFTQSNTQHEILGIVVANIGPRPQPTPPTPITTIVNPNNTASTTVSSISTTAITSTNASISAIIPTVSAAVISNTTTSPALLKTDVKSSYHVINLTHTTECQEKQNIDLLLSAVNLESQQKYGYFSRSVFVKGPIANIKTQGKVWIQEGEMLNLQVSCNGSGPFRYCAYYVQGPHNITGNETCQWENNLIQCQTVFFHYFRQPTNYTLVVIIANDVSKVITPIGINIYKVKKQPQISVIVVPVTFSSIAIIIVVFGVAYYFQNRSRYMVEVADFDFANNSDMECKTFRERLRDAISQAINRTKDYSEYDGSEERIGGLDTPQNQKYGSMQ